MTQVLRFIVIGVLAAACSPTSPKLLPKPDYSKPVEKQELGELLPPPVDILFVIDNSGSMGGYQNSMSQNADTFITDLVQNTDIDFHIGVIPSEKGELQAKGNHKVIRRTTPNLQNVLKENFLVGTNGSATEIFFDFIKEALSPVMLGGPNLGFYRDDALLAIVFLTDTDDQGTTSNIELYNYLVGMKGNPDLLATYGVVIPIGENRCSRDEFEPNKILEFISMSQGNVYNLCDSDYGTKLASIGSDIKSKAPQYVKLTKIPHVPTIKVSFGTQEIPNDENAGWVYDPKRNYIRFGKDLVLEEQNPGTQFEVFFIPADL